MAETDAQAIEKPQRWDLPFSRDLPNEIERRDISEEELDELLSIPPFSEMDATRFPRSLPLREILRNDTRIRSYRDGDAVVRVGEYGNSAFLIMKGSCRAIIDGLPANLFDRQDVTQKSLFGSFKQLFTNPRGPEVRDASRYPRRGEVKGEASASGHLFVQDVPNVLAMVPDAYSKTRNNVMPEGSLFGELSALGRVQRSVTVVAADRNETRLLEIRWQGLRELMRFDEALK
ncbi:MAG: hypothetical protein KDI19_06145, partial [Pseudomonadales bacterium]|nr:hypothetical protein [Pseudomonadales bacterium]